MSEFMSIHNRSKTLQVGLWINTSANKRGLNSVFCIAAKQGCKTNLITLSIPSTPKMLGIHNRRNTWDFKTLGNASAK